MDLSNRLFLVVGGTSGIGLAIARAAIAKGARVVVVGRNAERLQSALGSLGPNARGVAADVTNEDDVARLAKDVGNFDHLVVSTIDAHNEPIRTFDASAAAQTVASKLFAAALLAKHTSPQLAEKAPLPSFRASRRCARCLAGRWVRPRTARFIRSFMRWPSSSRRFG